MHLMFLHLPNPENVYSFSPVLPVPVFRNSNGRSDEPVGYDIYLFAGSEKDDMINIMFMKGVRVYH